MNELIKIESKEIGNESVQTVNARELHAFLQSKQDFSTWIKNRIEQYGFVENQDFILLHKKMEQVSGAKHLIEYHITLDMAKELAMVERNDKGKQARQYFITCEKQLHEQKQAVNTSLSEQLKIVQIGLLNRVLDEFGDKISPQARETLLLVGSEKFLGISTGYRPPVAQQTYSASEIGERLGISGNKVGRLAKAHNLKTEEYGLWVLDQSAHSNKQVSNFRYHLNVVPVLKALIN